MCPCAPRILPPSHSLPACVRQLWVHYKPDFFWWEIADLLRKLALTGLLVLIEDSELLRVLCAVLLSLLFVVLQMAYKPFKRSADNMTSTVFYVSLALVFLCVLLLKFCNLSPEACESFGFDGKGDGLFLFYVIFSLLVMLFMLLDGIYHLVSKTKQATGVLYLHSTRAVPELSLSEGNTYHLFLSHVWSSAQDQVAVIKRCGFGPCPASRQHARTRPCSLG